MSEKSSLSSRAWWIIAMLFLVALLNYLDRLMITTMRDPILAAIPMTDEKFGLLTSVFVWVYGVLSPLGGYLADRFNRRSMILGSLVVWSAVTWMTGYAQNFEQLLIARGLMGISEACYIPAALAMISDYHRGPTRSLATGLHMTGIYTGAALGGLGGIFAEHFSWRLGFECFGVIGIIYGVILFFFLKEGPRPTSESHSATVPAQSKVTATAALKALFGQWAFWGLLVVMALVSMANWGIYGWLPTYLKEHFNMGLGAAGMSATGYIQFASFVGVIAGGLWADRWSRSNPAGRSRVPALGYLAAAPCLFLAASTDLFPVAIAGLLVFGVARGFFDSNLMPVLRQVADQRFSATGYGFLNFIGCIMGGIMVWVGGVMKDAHIDLGRIFQFSALLLLLSAILLFVVRTRRNSPAQTSVAEPAGAAKE